MLTLALLLALLGLCLAYYYMKNYEKDNKLSKLKSVSSLPIIGHVHKLGWTKEEFLPSLEKMWIECGRDKFLLKIGLKDQVVITKPQDVEVLLSSQTQLEKNELYENYKELSGESIITHHQDHWRNVRKVLSPAFSYKFLEGYMKVFLDEIDILMMDIEAKLNEDIDIFPIFYNRALQTVCRVGMGFDFIENEHFKNYINVLNMAITLVNGRIFSAWKSISWLYYLSWEGRLFEDTVKELRKIKTKIIKSKKKELKDEIYNIQMNNNTIEEIIKSKNVNTFMELLLLSKTSEGTMFTDDEIVSELITLTFAGHETVATVAAFTAYCLALNPQIQDKAFNEQLVLTGYDLKKQITTKDLLKMKYLECVIKESMRLFCPSVFFGRLLTEDVVLQDGVVLPAGTNVLFLPFFSHKDPNVFPEPEKFDPNRYVINHPNQYTFFPFSAGPRNCIGIKWAMMEIKLWLATILRNYVFLASEGMEPKLIVEVVLKSLNGVNVRCKRRIIQ